MKKIMINNINYKVSNKFLYISLILILLNTFLEVPLPLYGAVYIPSFFLLLTIVVVYSLSIKLYLKDDYLYVISIFVFCIASAFLAPNYEDLGSRLFSAFQMLTSSIAFVVTLRMMSQLKPESRAKLLILGLRIILILTILEYFNITSNISDNFRSIAYSVGEYSAYSEEIRDIILSGTIRPKVFTSEPSLVAVGCFVLAMGAFWSSKNNFIICESIILIIIEYYFLNSPILFLVLLGALPKLYLGRRISIFSLLVPIVIGCIFILISSLMNDSLSRFSNVESFYDRGGETIETQSSENLRLINPYLSVFDVVFVNPISGLGIGGKRSLSFYSTYFADYVVAFGNNAFATIFIFFGIIGSIIFFYIFWRKVNRIIKFTPQLIVVVFLFLQTMGGFESARLWVYLAVIMSSTGIFLKFDNKNFSSSRL